MSYGGNAEIWLENHTDKPYFFQVLHQYTDCSIDSTPWIFVKPGESTKMLNVSYRYGFFTTGVDNWKVNGNDPSGQYWRAGHGFAADWKKHMLSSADNGKRTYIKIYHDIVQFVSDSGNSETQWFKNEGRGNIEPWGLMFDTIKMLTGTAKDIASMVPAKQQK